MDEAYIVSYARRELALLLNGEILREYSIVFCESPTGTKIEQ
jgi:hypothetical protein